MFNNFGELAQISPIDSDHSLETKPQETKIVNDNTPSHDNLIANNMLNQLETLKESLKHIPEVNAARVLYFRAEILLGNYQINSDKIAMKMLNCIEMA